MRRGAVLVAALAVAAGCKKQRADGSTAAEMTLPAGASLRDQMCACADRACAERVGGEFDAYTMLNRDQFHTDLVSYKLHALELEFHACADKFGRLTPPPSTIPALADARVTVDELKTRMCKCTDRDCARLVTADLAKLRNRIDASTVTEANPGALHDSYIELTRCMSLAIDGGAAILEQGSGSAAK